MIALLLFCTLARAFLCPTFSHPKSTIFRQETALFDGRGVATNYTWTEEAFELEVSVKVPPDTRASDLKFKALPTSIDLRLDDDTILLDGNRKMRGKISLDGTFWVISDSDSNEDSRIVTVTIEKQVRHNRDDFEVVDYDWKGVYPDDEEEVSLREYQEPEELNIREYAASLGVDIDNINMSMVDKTMFSSGLNLTRSTMDELSKSGYVQEVTQQSDGTEYITNEEGEVVPFSKLGETVADDEVRQAASASSTPSKIPFLDTNSPWHNAVPVDDLKDGEANADIRSMVSTEQADEQPQSNPNDGSANGTSSTSKRRIRDSDPIGELTVKRLKDILRAQGLKVSGSKKELQDRLRSHVGSMMNDDGKKEEENVR